ncbi:MAG: Zn-ribbon domain-containing OB-fold protein [Chloroflexi bacterium]|nr:Zn-ribbon domain-containing OB-fold protein [Chloroflexota bacterium]MCH8226686.1 Zn-ribbon domain-containing OB-fold protein [Chloroflexota bacterium]
MPVSVDSNRLRLTNEDGTEGVLVGFRCRECGTHVFGAATFCQGCTSDQLEPVDLSQHGTLYSYTIVRVPPAGWPGQVPYTLGQVQLPEGPQVLAEVVDCPAEDLKIGINVELTLRQVRGEESGADRVVYKWRPAGTT